MCGDWKQYGDKKCFKLIEKSVTEEEAVKECLKLDESASLATIHSSYEQIFIEGLILHHSYLSDRVWIGLKYSKENNTFRWTDGTDLDYQVWADDALRDGSEECVQISSVSQTLGKWTDESCRRKALVLCQKRQELTLDVLRFAIDNIEEKVKNSIIPIGFIYTQLPNQSAPHEMWTNTSWTEVTHEYSGLFFRAEGGDSESFGILQQAKQERLNKWEASFVAISSSSKAKDNGDFGSNQTTKISYHDSNYNYNYAITELSLISNESDIRPKNTAIRIWKRIEWIT